MEGTSNPTPKAMDDTHGRGSSRASRYLNLYDNGADVPSITLEAEDWLADLDSYTAALADEFERTSARLSWIKKEMGRAKAVAGSIREAVQMADGPDDAEARSRVADLKRALEEEAKRARSATLNGGAR